MYAIDARRLDLAREFRERPLGLHSPELQAVLDRMRSAPIDGKHCLIVVKPHEQWMLARMTGAPLQPAPVSPPVLFSSRAEAEWTVFKIRWRELTGHDLAAALGEPELPPPPAEIPPAPNPDIAILAYADKVSVAAGETVGFKVSCLGVGEYRAHVVRLRSPQFGPRGEGYREDEVATAANGLYRGRVQALRLGSFVAAPPAPAHGSFTLQIIAWPTRLAAGAQALLGSWSADAKRGAVLYVDAAGALALRIGDGAQVCEVTTGVRLAERRWHRLSASYDSGSGEIVVRQEPLPDRGFLAFPPAAIRTRAALRPAADGAPFLIGAWRGADGAPAAHFNGKLEAPRIYSRALDAAAVARAAADPLGGDLRDAALGAWDFSQRISTDDIIDLSPRQAHGRIVNIPMRAATGHNWTGEEMDWKRAPDQYGAIHFHDDDIDDAGWETDIALTVPAGMASGVYAMRLRGGGAESYVPFFVRPPRGAAAAPIAYLAATATYAAYHNNVARFRASGTEMLRGQMLDFDVTDMQLLRHRLGLSTYCVHSDGSGVCYGARLRPVTNFRPKGRLWNFASDLFVIDWLERAGHGYDVITDDDLHEEGVELLRRYQTIVTGSHPEYVSLQMLDAIDAYLRGGGRMMYLGGNGFYWRIAYRPDRSGVVEVRRAEDGTRAWNAAPGEYYMSFTGEYGGLWSRQGRPPNAIAGVGFIAQGFDVSSYYRRKPGSRDPRARFIFEGIDDEVIGDFGYLGGGAAGDEIDAFDPDQGSPAHALVLATSEMHSNAFHLANDAVLVPNGGANALHSPLVRADMTFFECPNGGAVFSTGSIAYCGSLAHDDFDNNIARLTGNVLRRFLDPAPFPAPEPDPPPAAAGGGR